MEFLNSRESREENKKKKKNETGAVKIRQISKRTRIKLPRSHTDRISGSRSSFIFVPFVFFFSFYVCARFLFKIPSLPFIVFLYKGFKKPRECLSRIEICLKIDSRFTLAETGCRLADDCRISGQRYCFMFYFKFWLRWMVVVAVKRKEGAKKEPKGQTIK